MDTQHIQPWQENFLNRADELEERAETSRNPEFNYEWADTLRKRTHLDVDSAEQAGTAQPPSEEERPMPTFLLGKKFSEIEPMDLEPIWDGWIYSGFITGIVGEQGAGKSTFMSALAARVSSGRNGPDGGQTRMGRVLYIGPEEDDSITVVRRLRLEEAEMDNVISLRDVFDFDFMLPTHIKQLGQAIQYYKASLVIIDPISACIARGHTLNSVQGARDILSPTQKMLAEKQAGMIFIHHFNKGQRTAPTNIRGAGSHAIYDFLRIYATLSLDQATGKVILHQDKNNLCIEDMKRPPDLTIEKLSSGKLFFSGVGNSPDFRAISEMQRLSMGRQAIMMILDSNPLRDWKAGTIHQCMLDLYPNMPRETTFSLLSRMSTPNGKGHTDIGKVARGVYYSYKRAALLEELKSKAAVQQPQPDTNIADIADIADIACQNDVTPPADNRVLATLP